MHPRLLTPIPWGNGHGIVFSSDKATVPLFLTLVCISKCEVINPSIRETTCVRVLRGLPFSQEFERLAALLGMVLNFHSIIANIDGEDAMAFQSKMGVTVKSGESSNCELLFFSFILTGHWYDFYLLGASNSDSRKPTLASLTSGLPSPSKRLVGSASSSTQSSSISLKDYAKPFAGNSESALIIF